MDIENSLFGLLKLGKSLEPQGTYDEGYYCIPTYKGRLPNIDFITGCH